MISQLLCSAAPSHVSFLLFLQCAWHVSKSCLQCHFFSVVLGYVWLELGLLRHVARLSMRFLFWLHRDLSDLCRTSNETYTIGFTRSQLLCLLRESCGRATWPQQQLWIFYILVRPREREREEERGCKLGIGERRGFGAEVNNWKNLSPGGIYSSPVVGRRGDVCWEGSSLNGMPKGERRGGEWVRGRSCKKIWNWRAVVGGDLKGYLQARRGPRGGQRGNHWKQSKGVPRTQKINQSFSTSYVQLVWLYFFLSTFESSEAQLLSP